MCQPPFLCFNSFAPFVIFYLHWMDEKTKARRGKATCSGDPKQGGLTDSEPSTLFVALRLPLNEGLSAQG